MTPTDRAIVAAAEERDRECSTQFSDGYHYVFDKNGYIDQAAFDRRELLRIVREQDLYIARLKDTLANPITLDAAPIPVTWDTAADAEDTEAAEAEFLRPIGPGR